MLRRDKASIGPHGSEHDQCRAAPTELETPLPPDGGGARPYLQTIPVRAFADEIERLMARDLDGIDYSGRVEALSVVADPDLLSQAVINLLHNAVDAVAAAENPRIELSCTRQDGMVLISVTDNGKGVPPDHADDIFVPFFTTKAGGSGIGLAVVRQVTTKHGGQVSVSANPRGGACFRLSLPDR